MSRRSHPAHGRREPTSSSAHHDVISPVTGQGIDRVPLASAEEIARRLTRLPDVHEPVRAPEVLEFLHRLREQLVSHRERLLEVAVLETGFITGDSREIVSAAIEFLGDFERYAREQTQPAKTVRHSYSPESQREMLLTQRPYRWIAALVPQNASFTLAITIIASALYAGARVLLRPSLQCAGTGAILADLIERSRPPSSSVVMVNSLAAEFLKACYQVESIDLIHYIGSNQHALSVFVDSFAAKKVCLLDGQGNGLLYVDDTVAIDQAARLITAGATRYNGETCTSVNGVLVHENVHADLRDALRDSFQRLRVGDPRTPGTEVGPLFSHGQAASLASALRGGGSHRVLCGGNAFGAYFTPAIVERVHPEDAIVREGFFGPALWIHPIHEDELFAWLRTNQFPLSDTVLTTRSDLIQAFASRSKAARICVNQDPSVESMFEPWGGYPPSGLNPVSNWIDKYRQSYQLDGRLDHIRPAPAES
jgi:acyl-CoA reductase-like NAD-dependent aldehyde dehydrogenase